MGASDMINVLFMQRPHKIFLPEWLARMIYGQEFPFLRNFSCFAHVSKDLKDYDCLFWAQQVVKASVHEAKIVE